MKKFFKKPIVIIATVIIVGLIITGIVFAVREKKPEYSFAIAEYGSIAQEVSVTGQVKSADSVDLAFERSGKVGKIYVDVGDKVTSGQVLASLINSDLMADLLQAQANLETEQANLNELKSGTRPEELQQAETDVKNKQITLENVKNQAEADLDSDYSAALSAIQNAVVKAKNAILTLTDIQYDHFSGNDANSLDIASAKGDAVEILLGGVGFGRSSADQISILNGGAFGVVQSAVVNPTHENIDLAIIETRNALQKVKFTLDIVPVTDDLTATQKTNLATEKNSINTEITTVASSEQAIVVQKATNASSIATAENNLASAQDTLDLKLAGATPEQIAAQEARVKSARSRVANTNAQIEKTIIRSPISGTVSKQDAKLGEIISANIELISVISEAEFQVETNIPEADIAKIAIGNTAVITLDAYGDDEIFNAGVIAIDPAETKIEGVSTYKVTLQFAEENGRIKSGMTANIDILTAEKESVLVIPQRAVIYVDGDRVVRILNDDGTIREASVQTGIRGTDGKIEVLKGVSEGDKVITVIRE